MLSLHLKNPGITVQHLHSDSPAFTFIAKFTDYCLITLALVSDLASAETLACGFTLLAASFVAFTSDFTSVWTFDFTVLAVSTVACVLFSTVALTWPVVDSALSTTLL